MLENMNDCLPAIPMLLILRHKLSQSAYKISPCTNKRTRFSAGNPMYRGSPLLDISSSKILQHHTVYARLTAINYTRGLASHRTKVLAVQDAVGAAGFVVETCSCAGRGTLCPTALGAIEGAAGYSVVVGTFKACQPVATFRTRSCYCVVETGTWEEREGQAW